MSLFGGELILVAKQAPLRSEAKIMFMERLSLLILFFALPGSAEAENGAPKWLLGRSVVLQYTEARSFEPVEPGSGRPHDDTVDFRTIIYISSRGRIFAQSQSAVTTAYGSRSYNLIKSPDAATQGSDWRFEGETLLGLNKMGDDASVERVGVRFDHYSQTCTMTLAYARAKGSEGMVLPGWHGEHYYLRRHQLTSSVCELKAGNAFDTAN